MSSSEIVDSGRPYGARSNFSQTCNLLSQYLKENGGFGDLTLGLPPTSGRGALTETMNLLPMIEKSGSRDLNSPPAAAFSGGEEEAHMKPEAETGPMTIFYAGQVIVFNDFPAEKAKEIMAFACKSNAVQNHPSAAFTPPLAARIPAEPATSVPNIIQPPLDSDLPIARKNSLARFLEKRRDRITSNAPYAAAAKAAPKQAKAEAWLGLGPQPSFQIFRNQ